MYYLSLASVFKEETKYLIEWLEYHLLVGVDHFYLFLHDTGEELEKVEKILKTYPQVYYIPYNYKSGDFQIHAFDLAWLTFQKETHWLGFIDLDEFVFPVQPNVLLPEIFQKYEDNQIKGLNVAVCTFGDSYRQFSPTLQTVDLTRRATKDSPCNYTSKQFFNGQAEQPFKHYGYGGNCLECINEDFKRTAHYKDPRPSNLIRVNHYPIRSTEDWNNKRNRNWPSDLEKHRLSDNDWRRKHFMLNKNDIQDTSMNKFSPELAEKVDERMKLIGPIIMT